MPISQTNRSTAQNKGHSEAPVSLSRSLRWFLFAILALTVISLGYTLIARWLGYGLPYSFPELFAPRSFFADFFEFRVRFYDFGKPGFFVQNRDFMYPPAMVLPL